MIQGAAAPVASASTRDLERRIEEQGKEIRALKQKVDALEERANRFKAGYYHGFFIGSGDDNFLFKIRFWTDLYYQYDYRPDNRDSNTFGIRRARWLFTGHAFNPKLTYAVMPEMVTQYRTTTSIYTTGGGDSVIITDEVDLNWRLLYLWAQYEFCKEFAVRVGEFIAPTERYFRRTNVIFMGDLPLIATTEPFVAGFHLGLNIFGTIADHFKYNLFAVNGTGFDRLNVNKSFLTGLRLSWFIMGDDDLSTSDYDYSEKPIIAASVVGAYDKADGNIPARGNRGDNTVRFGADATFKYAGFSIVPEFLLFWNETQHRKDWAVGVQTGYFIIPHAFELAAQASYLNYSGRDNDRNEYSAGFNYYFYGQPVKLQVDYSFLLFRVPGTDQKDHRFRVNFQLGFF